MDANEFFNTDTAGASLPRRINEIYAACGRQFLTGAQLTKAKAVLAEHDKLAAVCAHWDKQALQKEVHRLQSEYGTTCDGTILARVQESLWNVEHCDKLRQMADAKLTDHFCREVAPVAVVALQAELDAVVQEIGEEADRQKDLAKKYGVDFKRPAGDVFAALVFNAQYIRHRLNGLQSAIQGGYICEPAHGLFATAFELASPKTTNKRK